MSRRDELWQVVRSIPTGRVASYGDCGRELIPPVSGLIVGKWMALAPADVPWWRVVARDGRLVVGRRDPRLAAVQRSLLEAEGVPFEGDRVDMEAAQHAF
ncbi:MAG: MGMT family protein [Fimbriimonadales bacterium]|nr:MGMT family protein [Fimbriimonadales bacterium]